MLSMRLNYTSDLLFGYEIILEIKEHSQNLIKLSSIKIIRNFSKKTQTNNKILALIVTYNTSSVYFEDMPGLVQFNKNISG